MKTKNVVAGLGEIGQPILKLISKNTICVGYDKDKKLMNSSFEKYSDLPTKFLHVCIPYTNHFISNVMTLEKLFSPEFVVIHSTIKPYTTQKIQSKSSIPIIYSAIRGVHKRMSYDLKRYTKFFAIEKNVKNNKSIAKSFSKLMKQSGIKTKQMSEPLTLELAKIVCDTSYYGWLINYAQMSKMITMKHNVDYDEMWTFSDEIHNYLGNRPKMFPGIIGGHCVLPNLELIENEKLNMIKSINKQFNTKTVKKGKLKHVQKRKTH